MRRLPWTAPLLTILNDSQVLNVVCRSNELMIRNVLVAGARGALEQQHMWYGIFWLRMPLVSTS